MHKISPVITAPIAVAVIIFTVFFLVTPEARANHDHWTRAYQGDDMSKVLAASGDVQVCDREKDGHHVIIEISRLVKGKNVVTKKKDENGSKKGCTKFNVGAYNATAFRTGENTGKKNILGHWIYNFGKTKVIDYDH